LSFILWAEVMTVEQAEHDSEYPQPGPQPIEPRIVRSEDLFAGQKTVVIRHGSEDYRLLITRNDRLILQK
jgi:hemin uptake protein HemP